MAHAHQTYWTASTLDFFHIRGLQNIFQTEASLRPGSLAPSYPTHLLRILPATIEERSEWMRVLSADFKHALDAGAAFSAIRYGTVKAMQLWGTCVHNLDRETMDKKKRPNDGERAKFMQERSDALRNSLFVLHNESDFPALPDEVQALFNAQYFANDEAAPRLAAGIQARTGGALVGYECVMPIHAMLHFKTTKAKRDEVL